MSMNDQLETSQVHLHNHNNIWFTETDWFCHHVKLQLQCIGGKDNNGEKSFKPLALSFVDI